jgi:integrase
MTELEQIVEDRVRLSRSSKDTYLKALRSFHAFAGNDPKGWTPPAVVAWRKHLRKTMSPQSVNLYLAGLKSASRWWSQMKMDPNANFAQHVESLEVTESIRPKHAVTEAQATSLIRACDGKEPIDLRDKAICVLGFRTGMRRSSIVRIDLGHFDTQSGALKIWLKGNSWHTLPPLDEPTKAALEPWLQWLKSVGALESPKSPVFVSLNLARGAWSVKDRLKDNSLYKAICKRAENANLKSFSPHVFRHSFVTWMKKLGVPDEKIAAYTGHVGSGGGGRGGRVDFKMLREYTDTDHWIAETGLPSAKLPRSIG